MRFAPLALCSVLVLGFQPPPVGAQDGEPWFEDVTATHLPVLDGPSMDGAFVDVDGDGDLDLVIAVEYRRNRLLINDGSGVFSDRSEDLLPFTYRDSEDVGAADFDGDGDPDLAFVSEEDYENELFLNDGTGRFVAAHERLAAVQGTSNALHVADVDVDGWPDLVIGNAGANTLALNDGQAWFTADSTRLPPRGRTTQDVEMADVDGDGDLDILEASEGLNAILINNGDGYFTYEDERIEKRDAPEETREADLGDIDCDGDLDLYFANVHHVVPNSDPQDRLLVNDGNGFFLDETEERLPPESFDTWEVDFLDLDCDGDLDIITGNGDLTYRPETGWQNVRVRPYRALLNDGRGFFVDATDRVFPAGVEGYGWDVVAGDVDGNGSVDLYLASRWTQDFLLLSTANGACSQEPCSVCRVRRPSRRLVPVSTKN